MIQQLSQYASSTSWGDFICNTRGRGDLHPDIVSIPHSASHIHSLFQNVGTPAIMLGAPWSGGIIEAVLRSGSHKSSENGIDFLRNEIANMREK